MAGPPDWCADGQCRDAFENFLAGGLSQNDPEAATPRIGSDIGPRDRTREGNMVDATQEGAACAGRDAGAGARQPARDPELLPRRPDIGQACAVDLQIADAYA